ncbi:MAG: hypothetical protein ACK4Z0_00165 [Sphingomonadaceae bacterium]
MNAFDALWTLAGPALLTAAIALDLWLLGCGMRSMRRALAGPAALVHHVPPGGEAQVIALRPRPQASDATVSFGVAAPRRLAA